MDDETAKTRRSVLQRLAVSGALTTGFVGLASAQDDGNRGDGNRGNGRGGGRGGGGGGGSRPPGSGPTRETGGSGLIVKPEGSISAPEDANLPNPGEFFTIGEESGSPIAWYSGCDSVGSKARANSYQGYDIAPSTTTTPALSGEFDRLHIVDKRPVIQGEYRVAEVSFCGQNLSGDDIDDARYYNGFVWKFGWEPGDEETNE